MHIIEVVLATKKRLKKSFSVQITRIVVGCVIDCGIEVSCVVFEGYWLSGGLTTFQVSASMDSSTVGCVSTDQYTSTLCLQSCRKNKAWHRTRNEQCVICISHLAEKYYILKLINVTPCVDNGSQGLFSSTHKSNNITKQEQSNMFQPIGHLHGYKAII